MLLASFIVKFKGLSSIKHFCISNYLSIFLLSFLKLVCKAHDFKDKNPKDEEKDNQLSGIESIRWINFSSLRTKLFNIFDLRSIIFNALWARFIAINLVIDVQLPVIIASLAFLHALPNLSFSLSHPESLYHLLLVKILISLVFSSHYEIYLFLWLIVFGVFSIS